MAAEARAMGSLCVCVVVLAAAVVAGADGVVLNALQAAGVKPR